MVYFGSKATSGLRQLLPGLQPPYDLYVETYPGGGALMKRKAPALDWDRPGALDGFGCDCPVKLIHSCAHAFLAGFAFRGTELVYSDPCWRRADRSGGTATTTPKPTMSNSLNCSRGCRVR